MGSFKKKGTGRKGRKRKDTKKSSFKKGSDGKSGYGRRSAGTGRGRSRVESSERKPSGGLEKRSRTGYNGRPRRAMDVDAICDNCGKDTTVPFKPSAGKPVYCSDCYKVKDRSKPSGKSDSNVRELAIINRKLDKIMKALKIK